MWSVEAELAVPDAATVDAGAAGGVVVATSANGGVSISEAIGFELEIPMAEGGGGTRFAAPAGVAATTSPAAEAWADEFAASAGSIRGRSGDGADGAIIAASSTAKSLGATSSR